MNLVQIQERLKDLPMQAVMAYANGQNPQVPPYLALGEMNRRKQMEQQAAQPPKGTVKDNIEQQVGLMQLQKLRQGQMAQQSSMQGAQAPTIPQGTPEPAMQPEAEMAMAGGGLTSLPMREMNFGSGGIVAFANPENDQLVSEAEAAAKAAKQKLSTYSLSQRLKDPEGYAAAQAEAAIAEDRANKLYKDTAGKETGPAGALGKTMSPPIAPPMSRPTEKMTPQQMEMTQVKPAAAPAPTGNVAAPGNIVNTNQPRPPAPPTPPAPPAPPAPPVSAAQKFQEGILAGTGLPAIPTEWTPPKQAPIGEDYMKYMTDREQKRREDAMRFENVEKDRARRDLWSSLIAGGEATRGQRGIGSLFAGTGKNLGESLTAAEERSAAFQQKQQDLADNDAKTKFEIANLRRAEERGDSKAIYESKVKLVELSNQRAQMQSTTANAMAQNESAERVARANNLTQLEVARINQVTQGRPGETERLLMQYAELKRTKGEAAAEDFMRTIERVKTGTRGETAQQKLNVQRQALAEKLPAYQMAMSSYVSETDPAKKAKALTKIRELESLHGIKSDEAPTVDSSQWGNLKVK